MPSPGPGADPPVAALLPALLEGLYERFDDRSFVHPDPLEFLFLFDDCRDREVVAILASALAYGRVESILRSVRRVLDLMGDSPSAYLASTTDAVRRRSLRGFRHRFTDGTDLARLLSRIHEALDRHGSLENLFLAGLRPEHTTVVPALTLFAAALRGKDDSYLIPDPDRGSACKRLHLMLRWMVRRDRVDPGCWKAVSPALLVVPLDTHMYRFGRALGFTTRRSPDLTCALQITDAFRRIRPDDPVRYDFCLTRLGIRTDADPSELLNALAAPREEAIP